MDTFWFDDFQVLFQKDKLDEFIPTQEMNEISVLTLLCVSVFTFPNTYVGI